MTVLERLYASRPVGKVVRTTLQVESAARPPLRFVDAYYGMRFGVGGVLQDFEPAPMEFSLPARDTSGQQRLTFAVSALDGRPRRYVDEAQAAGTPVWLTLAQYLEDDPLEPIEAPLVMVLEGGRFSQGVAAFEGSYYDVFNTAWPRDRYTLENAPGIEYIA